MGPFFTKFGLPLAACIALLGSRFVAPGVSALPNLRYANTSKQASAVEVGSVFGDGGGFSAPSNSRDAHAARPNL